jgi:hypothetical protein
MPARRENEHGSAAGAIGQWQSLPFPVRLAGIFLAGMAMIWLTRWLGVSVLVALLLWCAVGIGLVHAGGRLSWVDRYPLRQPPLRGRAPGPPSFASMKMTPAFPSVRGIVSTVQALTAPSRSKCAAEFQDSPAAR